MTILDCKKNDVDLVPDKTKLVAFTGNPDLPDNHEISIISLNGLPLPFSSEAEHLGVLRTSNASNVPNIMKRIAAHRRKLFSLLPGGLARGHYASPAASLKIEKIYALPVLLSGLASLVLRKSDLNVLHNYYKNVLRRLLRLPQDVAECAVWFLSGSLPIEALLHIRILSLFGMICNLGDNPLPRIARNALVRSRPSSKSWFHMVRNICLKYDLPHPLQLLDHPLPANKFKDLYKCKISVYWRYNLSQKCASLSSLRFLQTGFISLSRPHPILANLRGNPYESRACYVQVLLLAGRYRTEKLRRHWSNNKNGYCILPSCKDLKLTENEEHFLLHCRALMPVRRRLLARTLEYASDKPIIQDLLSCLFTDQDDLTKLRFMLDPSTLPAVISAVQKYDDETLQYCFKIGRMWCLSLHNARVQLIEKA